MLSIHQSYLDTEKEEFPKLWNQLHATEDTTDDTTPWYMMWLKGILGYYFVHHAFT